MTSAHLLDTLERCYDALPRPYANTEEIGPLTLFIADTSPWPYYARPTIGTNAVTIADVERALARQRELGLPESIEWVDDITPSLLPAVRALGLTPILAPLMVLDRGELGPTDPRARVLDPDAEDFGTDLAMARAVQHVGFTNGGTSVGSSGLAERDAAVTALADAELDWHRARHRSGAASTAVAETVEGMLAAGAFQRALDTTELVGIATLPAARKQGLGGAVTAALAHHAVDTGAGIVFLSAASEDVARVYSRFGFRRVGTACIVG